jgi:hypothetical protein
MCQICDALTSKKITSEEAINMLGLSNVEASHMFELVDLVMAHDVPLTDTDPELDAIYEKELKG